MTNKQGQKVSIDGLRVYVNCDKNMTGTVFGWTKTFKKEDHRIFVRLDSREDWHDTFAPEDLTPLVAKTELNISVDNLEPVKRIVEELRECIKTLHEDSENLRQENKELKNALGEAEARLRDSQICLKCGLEEGLKHTEETINDK